MPDHLLLPILLQTVWSLPLSALKHPGTAGRPVGKAQAGCVSAAWRETSAALPAWVDGDVQKVQVRGPLPVPTLPQHWLLCCITMLHSLCLASVWAKQRGCQQLAHGKVPDCLSVHRVAKMPHGAAAANAGPLQIMSRQDETAQVHPHKLTLDLIREARHCTLRRATVTGVSTAPDGSVTGGLCRKLPLSVRAVTAAHILSPAAAAGLFFWGGGGGTWPGCPKLCDGCNCMPICR